MNKVTLSDILDIAQYERARDKMRASVIALKKTRRVELGPNLSLVFENRETVLFQIQEMMRTERIVDDAKIQDEINVYNGLIPDAGEVSATLFVEIPGIGAMSHAQAIAAVNHFQGLDEGGIVLTLGTSPTAARFESGFTKEEKMAAVQFLRFPLGADAARFLGDPGVPVFLTADNGRYTARTELSAQARAELARDLA